MPGAPRADPSVRNYRTGLLPWVKRVRAMTGRRGPLRCLAYPLQGAWHVTIPAVSPVRVVLWRIPLGPTASLHPLRWPEALVCPSIVRGFLRYYQSVRLLVPVHRRRAPRGFATRPAAPSSGGWTRDLAGSAQGVSVRAQGLRPRWVWLRLACGAPASVAFCRLEPHRHPRPSEISWLNTRPARTSVNASRQTSRPTTHDSRPVWLASPSPYDSFIRYTSPAYPGALQTSEIRLFLGCRGPKALVLGCGCGLRHLIHARRARSLRAWTPEPDSKLAGQESAAVDSGMRDKFAGPRSLRLWIPTPEAGSPAPESAAVDTGARPGVLLSWTSNLPGPKVCGCGLWQPIQA